MTSKKVRKSCLLKTVQVVPPLKTSFATAVQHAVEVLSRATDRRLELEKDSGRYRVLNDFFPPVLKGHPASGSVFAFTMDANMNGVVLDPKAKSYPMKVLAPKRDASERTEFVEGLTWFSVKGNYLAILASRAVSVDVLEDYFSWLLGAAAEASGNLKANAVPYAVRFNNPPKPELRAYDMTNLKSIAFKGGIQSTSEGGASNVNRRDSSRSSFSLFKPIGPAYSALKAFVEACGATLPKFEGADSPETFSNLNVELRVSAPKKLNAQAARAFLQKTAENIRDADDDTLEYRFADGRTLKPSQLIVANELVLDLKEGLPDSVSARRKLNMWLLEQIGQLENPPPSTESFLK